MMWVSKIPNYDAYGLFRALHSHNPGIIKIQKIMKFRFHNLLHLLFIPLFEFDYNVQPTGS